MESSNLTFSAKGTIAFFRVFLVPLGKELLERKGYQQQQQ